MTCIWSCGTKMTVLVFRAWQRNCCIILYWHVCQKNEFVIIHNDRFIGQGPYTAEKRVFCQVLLWPDSWFWILTIWFGTVMMSLITQNVAAACWICCSSWRRKVWGTWQPHQCVLQSLQRDGQRPLAWPSGSPCDAATIVWMQLSNCFPNK